MSDIRITSVKCIPAPDAKERFKKIVVMLFSKGKYKQGRKGVREEDGGKKDTIRKFESH